MHDFDLTDCLITSPRGPHTPHLGTKRHGKIGRIMNRKASVYRDTSIIRVTFTMEEIFGQPPETVVRLFRSCGIDPTAPYRAKFTFNDITIEQDL